MGGFIHRWERAWETGSFPPRLPWEVDVFCRCERHEKPEKGGNGPRTGWLRSGGSRRAASRATPPAVAVRGDLLGLPVSTVLPPSPPSSPRAGGRAGCGEPPFIGGLPVSLAWPPVAAPSTIQSRGGGLCSIFSFCWPRRSTGRAAALSAAAVAPLWLAPEAPAVTARAAAPEVQRAVRLEPAPAASEAVAVATVEQMQQQQADMPAEEEEEALPGSDEAAAAIGGQAAALSAAAAEGSGSAEAIEVTPPTGLSSAPATSEDGSDEAWPPASARASSGLSSSADGASRADSLGGDSAPDDQPLDLGPSLAGWELNAAAAGTEAAVNQDPEGSAAADEPAPQPAPIRVDAPPPPAPTTEPLPPSGHAGPNRHRTTRGRLGRGSGKTKQTARAAAAAAAVASALQGLPGAAPGAAPLADAASGVVTGSAAVSPAPKVPHSAVPRAVAAALRGLADGPAPAAAPLAAATLAVDGAAAAPASAGGPATCTQQPPRRFKQPRRRSDGRGAAAPATPPRQPPPPPPSAFLSSSVVAQQQSGYAAVPAPCSYAAPLMTQQARAPGTFHQLAAAHAPPNGHHVQPYGQPGWGAQQWGHWS
ncbi:hypothetical protein Rsub_03820 [Raphidocelis subcapitata]|uniref:Uncharacterized protein n=1 Tax=Raphidocelis subcapitata TaxID=307507 RepID=A0A2V0P1K0_9CHLO|nr:hypothetical protein Rsub_03820 [Raphidocelis subcapitata]|eukprot:GBF90965.1 hypothetical protein Rsub_03820 [Raphidocelis subcapitata]